MEKKYLTETEQLRFVGFVVFSLIVMILATVAMEAPMGIFTPEFAFGCMISYGLYVLTQLPALIKACKEVFKKY